MDESQDKQTNENFFDSIKPNITDPLVKSLLQTLTAIAKMLTADSGTKAKKGSSDMYPRISDVISYFICCGLLDKYYKIFQCIREPLEDTSVLMAYHTTIEMLQGIVAAVVRCVLLLFTVHLIEFLQIPSMKVSHESLSTMYAFHLIHQ